MESVEAICPKCASALRVAAAQLRTPHPLHCEGCHHESALEVSTDDLEPLMSLTA